MKILLIEDSQHLRTYLSIALEREGYAVDTAEDGEEGRWLIENSKHDVILLDIMLPKLDGLTLLHQLREQGLQTPILLLTAKGKVEERVKGLQMGADDYLVKPFDIGELIARVQALIRRKYDNKCPKIFIEELCVDTAAKTISISNQTVSFTSKEYLILEYLVLRRGEVVSRDDIEEHIYDMNAEIMSNAVNSTISIIRKKLSSHSTKEIITTHRGLGYSVDT